MEISTRLDLTEDQKQEIIKRWKATGKTDYGSGHYLSVRKAYSGNILVSYHDDGNSWGGEKTHHGEFSIGKIEGI